MASGIFSCALWPPACFLWRNVYLHPLPVLILDIHLYQIYDLNILSVTYVIHSVERCLSVHKSFKF